MKINPLMLIDFYKADHRRQYPEGTELVYSNFGPAQVQRRRFKRTRFRASVLY